MADTTPAQDPLALPKQEPGLGFRAEMAATNLLLGYWRHALAAVALGLLLLLAYGQYTSYSQRNARATAAAIAEVERKLPAPVFQLAFQKTQGETLDLEALGKTAQELDAIGASASGASAVQALLDAAELYRIAEQPGPRRTALEKAAPQAKGVLKYAVVSSLANLDLDEGHPDEAIARLKELAADPMPYLAQQGTLDLAIALDSQGKADEARAARQSFLDKWPDAPQAPEIRSAIGAPAPAPAAAPAPTEAPPAPAGSPAPAPVTP